MNRHRLLALALGLVVVSVAAAGIPTRRFNICVWTKGNEEKYLAVRGGKLVLGQSTINQIYDDDDAVDRWYIDGTRIKSSVGGRYLAYDPSGKSRRVFLKPRPGKGTEWTINSRHVRRLDYGQVQAGSGKLQGWYLDMEEVRVRPKNGWGKPVTVRRLVLSKKPVRKVEAERIYRPGAK